MNQNEINYSIEMAEQDVSAVSDGSIDLVNELADTGDDIISPIQSVIDWDNDNPTTVVIPEHILSLGEANVKEYIWKHCKESILKSMKVTALQESSLASHDYDKSLHQNKKRRFHSGQEFTRKKKLRRENLLNTIADVQRQFFQSLAPKEVFGGLLESLLKLMDSKYGFIGEKKFTDEGTMYLQTHAITNVAWNKATQQFYEDNAESGLKFFGLDNLFGSVMKTEKPVIANNPTTDKRAGGLPEGHPPLNYFLGLPFFRKGEMTGMVGISNKPGGYTQEDIEFLEPLMVTCSNLIQGFQQVEENKYLINNLEKVVKTRTIELENANQQVRQNAAMQLQHFACMSHEIRTPLNCIIGMSSLLKDTQLDPTQEESLKMMISSGELLLAIVNDVLDYSKLETDHVDIEVKRSSLQDMLKSLIYSIEMKTQNTGQRIKAIYDPSLPEYLITDMRRIQQILFNLLGNAVKFSKENGVVELFVTYEREAQSEKAEIIDINEALSIAKGRSAVSDETKSEKRSTSPSSKCPFQRPKSNTAATSADKSHCSTVDTYEGVAKESLRSSNSKFRLVFRVKDYGTGIKKSDFESIFRPFQQSSVSHSDPSFGGTGLGLAITKKLVDALGGTIAVDSDLGNWSEFTVQLPCSDAPAPIDTLAKKISDVTLLLLGLPKDQKDNVLRVFKAFEMDVRLVETMEDVCDHIASQNMGSAPIKNRIICLFEGSHVNAESVLKAMHIKDKNNKNVSFFTFGSRISDESKLPLHSVHHLISLEQVVPQALVEIFDERLNLKSQATSGSLETTFIPKESGYSHLRVLIAEDNLVNQKVLSKMLSRLGVQSFDVVDNGRDAVQQEASQAYDVILMDQQMPILNGIEACRAISERPDNGRPVPCIIFVTAHVSVSFEKECAAAGSSGFLPKPFKLESVEKCLKDVSKILIDRSFFKRR